MLARARAVARARWPSWSTATGLLPGDRPPAGRGARGARPGAARRRRALRARPPARRARSGRGRGARRCRRRPSPRCGRCATRPARACSSTCATATAASASRRSSRPTGCARSCRWGRRCPSTPARPAACCAGRRGGRAPLGGERRRARGGGGVGRARRCADRDGAVVAAVSVSGPIERTTRQPGRRYGDGGRRGRSTASRLRSGRATRDATRTPGSLLVGTARRAVKPAYSARDLEHRRQVHQTVATRSRWPATTCSCAPSSNDDAGAAG